MGVMKFAVYPPESASYFVDVEGAYLTGRDNMAWPTQVRVEDGVILAERKTEGTCAFNLRWELPKFGKVVLSTTGLIAREEPYHLQVELARAKVRAVLDQLASWEGLGLKFSAETRQRVMHANKLFVSCLASQSEGLEAAHLAEDALAEAIWGGERLVLESSSAVLRQLRRLQPDVPPAMLGCSASALPVHPELRPRFRELFNYATVPLTWGTIEPQEGHYHWDEPDELIAWCLEHRLLPKVGPLLSFCDADLPEWLWLWEGDFDSLLTFVCDFVETTVARFRDRVQVWDVVSGANTANVLGLTEDQVLRLSAAALEVTKRVHPRAIPAMTLRDPWGDYLAKGGHSMSPLTFAEACLRADAGLAVIGLELLTGLDVPGGYCRDLLQVSALLEQYGSLGVPVHLSAVAAPSAVSPDPVSQWPDAHVISNGGVWHEPWSESVQADWLQQLLLIAMGKPYVHAVSLMDLFDGVPHAAPHGGVLHADGTPKEAWNALSDLRDTYLSRPQGPV